MRIISQIGATLDVAVTLALAASVVLIMLVFADLFMPPAGTVGTRPNYLATLTKSASFLGILFSPAICSATAWLIYVRQKRRGQPVFTWLRFVALASAVWAGFVFAALNDL